MSVLIFMWLVINFVHPFSLSLENRRELRFALKMKLLGSRLRSESNTSSESRLSNTPITLKADILNAWQNLQGSRSSANSSSFRKNSPEGLSRWMDGWLHTFWFAELWVSIQDLAALKPGLISSSLTWGFTIHSLSFEGPLCAALGLPACGATLRTDIQAHHLFTEYVSCRAQPDLARNSHHRYSTHSDPGIQIFYCPTSLKTGPRVCFIPPF